MPVKRILYLTNIEVPYRVRFLNELAEHCQLTVLYEREKSGNRDEKWAGCEKRKYRTEYLNGLKIGVENAFSFSILKVLFSSYDGIIVGCCNSPVQLFAVLVMRMFHIPFLLSTDGELFLDRPGLKNAAKRFFLSGATGYLAAGEQAAKSLKKTAGPSKITVYGFSSLYERELSAHAKAGLHARRNGRVLVVGQYFPYKGMDVALQAAAKNPAIRYQFVGMGSRTARFIREQKAAALKNVEIVPFLTKEALEKEYAACAMLLLPSRQECWGLVVNEAASFGMPIVSTWGSGAAVEFLGDKYARYLAKPGDAEDLYQKVLLLLHDQNKEQYTKDLILKSQHYSLEHMVKAHCCALHLDEKGI